MRTAAQRIARYNARMLSSLIDPTLSAVNTLAVTNYGAYASDFVPKQEQLRVLLNGGGISGPVILRYEAFNGELYHIAKSSSGSAAVTAATILVAKWTSYGGDAGILKSIANDLYGIIVP